jgi:acetylornithine deacetylase/succinyl-diaminopimelate desuccinylase-like protein
MGSVFRRTLAAVATAVALSGTAAYGQTPNESTSCNLERKVSVEEYVAKEGPQFVDNFLVPFVQIHSISAEPERKPDMLLAANYLSTSLQGAGMSSQLLNIPGGNPLVYGEHLAKPTDPTVLVYGHYDVQPVEDLNQWNATGKVIDPFAGVMVRDGNDRILHARGSTDDKGQIASWVLAAKYWKETNSWPGVNIKFVFEGDEEGGEAFLDYIKTKPSTLRSDIVIVSDTGTIKEGYPAIASSTKGLTIAKLSSSDPSALLRIIDGSHDFTTNRTLLPGFYDDVVLRKIDPALLREFGASSPDMGKVRPEQGFSALEHRWHRPTNDPLSFFYANKAPSQSDGGKTFEIVAHGPNATLHSGEFGGPVQNPMLSLAHMLVGIGKQTPYTVDFIEYGTLSLSTKLKPDARAQITLPSSADFGSVYKSVASSLDPDLFSFSPVENRSAYLGSPERFGKNEGATAFVSHRLVPNQKPENVYASIASFAGQMPGVKVENVYGAIPFASNTKSPYFHMIEEGLKAGYGTDGVHIIGSGGTLPLSAQFVESFGVDVIGMGFSGPDNNLHAPNEHIRVSNVLQGTRSAIYTVQNISRMNLPRINLP